MKYILPQQFKDDLINDLDELNIQSKQINYIHYNSFKSDYNSGLFIGLIFNEDELLLFLENLFNEHELDTFGFNQKQLFFLKSKNNVLNLLHNLCSEIKSKNTNTSIYFELIEDCLNNNNLDNSSDKLDYNKFSLDSMMFTCRDEVLITNEENKLFWNFLQYFIPKFFYHYYFYLYTIYIQKEIDDRIFDLITRENELNNHLYLQNLDFQKQVNNIVNN